MWSAIKTIKIGLMEHNQNDVAYYHPLVVYMVPII